MTPTPVQQFTRVFDPEALEIQMREDSIAALIDLATAAWRGDVTVRFRNLLGVGSNDPTREHFYLSLDLGVRVVDQANAQQPQLTVDPLFPTCMLNLLTGRGYSACDGQPICKDQQ